MCCDVNFKLHSALTVSRFAADGVHRALATELELVVARGICIVPDSTGPAEELLIFIHHHHVMHLGIILEHCINGKTVSSIHSLLLSIKPGPSN